MRLIGVTLVAIVISGTVPALAQDPSLAGSASGNVSAFPKQKGGLFGPAPTVDKTQPLNMQADKLVYDTSGNRVIARGNVEIFFNNYILTADEVIYDQSANTLTAVGNAVLKDPNGSVSSADRMTMTSDFRDGFVQSLSVVAKDDTRISAERATRREGNVTEFEKGRFTPCKSDGGMPPLWCLSAAKIIHDQQAASITYQDAQFELFGVPILYLPYFQHADPSVKRRSGFLAPSYGNSNNLGFNTEVPYYFALSDNFDFTFNPMYTARQGVLWQGEWRHRLENGQYTVQLAGIDQDASDLPNNNPELDGWRGSVKTKGLFSIGSWWNLGWDITVESDDSFRRFYGLDSVLLTDRVNNIFFRGLSDRNYFGVNLYQFGGLSFDDTAQSESRAHPIIDYNYIFADPVLGGELSWDTNFLSFSRADAVPNGSQEDITRLVTEVKWRRTLTDSIGIQYTPFAQLRGDIYQLNNSFDPQDAQTIDTDTVTRGIATGGITVSYPWIASTGSATHTIEPIGQIVGRQAKLPQRDLPDEDAKSIVFDDTNLFEVDKFSGYDRVETGTRANVGLQYTFQLNNGGYARFLAGQSFHLAGDNAFARAGVDPDDDPAFNPTSGLEKDQSDVILAAYLAPSQMFRIINQSRFDEEGFSLRRQDTAARFLYGPLLAQATYGFAASDDTLGVPDTQQDVTAQLGLRLTNNWSVLGSIRYDIDEQERLMDSLQLRYGDECFVLTATYTESFITDPDREIVPDRSIMLRFELKHLGSFGYKTDVLDHVYGEDQPLNR